MAKLYPPLEIIDEMTPAPTAGERKLLEFLHQNYNDEYEVFFQPFLNEARPDVVLMRKGGGIIIFEVKDWDLGNYKSTPTGTWIVRANGSRMRYTPIRQVVSYKDKLFSLNSGELFRRRTINGDRYSWSLVNCAVFFHGSTAAAVHALCYPDNITEKNKKFLEHVNLLGDDSLTKGKMDEVFKRTRISSCSRYFTTDIYDDLHRILKPDVHTIEMGIAYELSPAQRALVVSEAKARKRIKGVAGSGKSFVLARRAINAHKRTGKPVLILTYNITLKNYLHDRMSEVRENFGWEYFHIQNYHQQFNSMLADCSLSIADVAHAKWPDSVPLDDDGQDTSGRLDLQEWQWEELYADIAIFEGHADEIRKYDVIMIDEAQDYREEWVRIIMKYVATPDAEIVAFADEKQNVYDRALDTNKFPVIPITSGPWDRSLNASYRLTEKIGKFAVAFQQYFFTNKYSIDAKIEPVKQLELIFEQEHIEYHYLSPGLTQGKLKELAEYIREIIKAQSLHVNDVTVLSSNISLIREVSAVYESLFNENVNCMCESQSEFEKMGGDPLRVETARRFKKQNFWQNTGKISFSTVHSFKGLESPAVILIVGGAQKMPKSSNGGMTNVPLSAINVGKGSTVMLTPSEKELFYVGITRARNCLCVVNYGDERYDEFFNTDKAKEFLATVCTDLMGNNRNSVDTVA